METFTELIEDLDRGRVNTALTEGVKEVAAALNVLDIAGRSGSGSISLTLKFTLGDNGITTIAPSYDVKVPRKSLGGSIRFLQRNGELSTGDPRQKDLFEEGPEKKEVTRPRLTERA